MDYDDGVDLGDLDAMLRAATSDGALDEIEFRDAPPEKRAPARAVSFVGRGGRGRRGAGRGGARTRLFGAPIFSGL